MTVYPEAYWFEGHAVGGPADGRILKDNCSTISIGEFGSYHHDPETRLHWHWRPRVQSAKEIANVLVDTGMG